MVGVVDIFRVLAHSDGCLVCACPAARHLASGQVPSQESNAVVLACTRRHSKIVAGGKLGTRSATHDASPADRRACVIGPAELFGCSRRGGMSERSVLLPSTWPRLSEKRDHHRHKCPQYPRIRFNSHRIGPPRLRLAHIRGSPEPVVKQIIDRHASPNGRVSLNRELCASETTQLPSSAPSRHTSTTGNQCSVLKADKLGSRQYLLTDKRAFAWYLQLRGRGPCHWLRACRRNH